MFIAKYVCNKQNKTKTKTKKVEISFKDIQFSSELNEIIALTNYNLLRIDVYSFKIIE